QRRERALQQAVGDLGVEAGHRDCDAEVAAIGLGRQLVHHGQQGDVAAPARPPQPRRRRTALAAPHRPGDGRAVVHAPGFWLAFLCSVLLLAVALVSGLRGGRRLHLVAGPLAMVALVVAVACTGQLMASYSFPPDDLRFHLGFAKTAGSLALPVI